MAPAQRLQVAQAFWLDEEATDDHIQAAMLIAQRKKFRPKTVITLEPERKAHHLSSLSTLPDAVAVRALIAYHMADQRPMMAAFLDALGIAHEDGIIEDETVIPDSAKVGAAAEQLAGRFPPEAVSLYLNTLLCQDPETWNTLSGLPQRLEPALPDS